MSTASVYEYEKTCRGESTNLNDIALIRVIGRIEFSAKVTPVNLPSVDFDVETDGKGMVA